MTTEYELNTDLAKKAGQSLRISETGLYFGTITAAFACTSTKDTKGVELMFRADDGRTADYLQLWTRKASGESLMGEQVLHAIMTVTEQQKLTLKKGSIDRGGQTKAVELFPELTGKRVGLMLVREPYEKQDGSTGDSMLVFLPVEDGTKRTAKEKLDKAPKGEAYALILAGLKDKPLRPRQGGSAPRQAAPAHVMNGEPGDDVPW